MIVTFCIHLLCTTGMLATYHLNIIPTIMNVGLTGFYITLLLRFVHCIKVQWKLLPFVESHHA